mgnify:FL=1
MVANVLVELSNRNIDKTFTYNIPNELENLIKVGIRVLVPFGKQTLEGFVLSISENTNSEIELKDIIKPIDDEVILNEELLELGKFIKRKTLSTLISAYQVMLPKALKADKKTKINKSYESNIIIKDEKLLKDYKLTDKQKIIIDEIRNGKNDKKHLKDLATSSLTTLLNKGILEEVLSEKYRLSIENKKEYKKVELNDEQKNAVNTVLSDLDKSNTYLLYGVTGSGKTEVYMEIIDAMLLQGKTAIVLVPEISLTPQMVERFSSRFKENIAILHSRLNDGEKYDEYRKIARGEVKIVIGARSAIFAPLKNIGVIIVDEEHTTSYKQESTPKYNAIDIAVERAKHHNAQVVLGSATPTLESFAKVIKGIYKLIELKKRANNKALPTVTLVDMNKEKNRNNHFSKTLIQEIQNTLDRKEQVILLLNRRGYSSFVTCSNCGYVSKCPNCDITLTYHKTSDMERCHYCGYATKRKEVCPECHEKAIEQLGYGTEKIEEELKSLFNARVIRMDLDTTGTKGAHEKIISAFRNQEYDILLGTQMIAKGLDFANVTLVGVINADTSLMIPNFRSSEYTFDLLSQVSGRSGRGEKKGTVIIQTFNQDHYAIKLAKTHDYMAFFKEEMKIRKTLQYPPYCFLVSIKVISKDYNLAQAESNLIAKRLRDNLLNSTVLGPSIGSTFKINNTYRFGIIIKYKKEDNLYPFLEKLLDYYKINDKIRLDIDFNPITL